MNKDVDTTDKTSKYYLTHITTDSNAFKIKQEKQMIQSVHNSKQNSNQKKSSF